MQQQLKVIHFVAAIDRSLGGVSAYVQLLAKELGRLTDLIIATRPTANPLPMENCRVVYLPLPLGQIMEFRRQWTRLLRQERPDVVHVNGIWMLHTWIAQREAQRMGIRTFVMPHGMLEPWILGRHRLRKRAALMLYQGRALRQADGLVATAESEKAQLLRLGFNHSVSTIPNGIDARAISLRTDWGARGRVLFLSRIHPKKGIELLMEAAAMMGDALRGCTITIAGEGDAAYVSELKARAAASGLCCTFNFVGGVYGDDKWRLLREADVFALPTLSENFGIVVAEALACGTPVITTKGAPWADLTARGCGWWIDRSAETLAAALKQALGLTAAERERMGRAGRRLVEEKYSAESAAKALMEIYNTNQTT